MSYDIAINITERYAPFFIKHSPILSHHAIFPLCYFQDFQDIIHIFSELVLLTAWW
jgi:hypothetical protein